MKRSLREAINFIKQYKWNSILVKYFKTFFLLLILPISLLNIFIYSSSKSSTNKEIENFAKNSTTIIANTFNTSLDNFYKNHLLYTDDVNVQKYLSANSYDIFSTDFFPVISEIRTKMNIHIQSSSYLDSIYLYGFNNNYVISNNAGNPADYFHDTNWLDYYNTHKKSYYITPQKSPYDDYVSVCYELTNYNNATGLVVFNFDLQRFKQTLLSSTDSSIISARLCNENAMPVFTIGEVLTLPECNINCSAINDIQVDFDNKYLHTIAPIHSLNAVLQISFSLESLGQKSTKAIQYLLLGFIISIAIAAALSVYFSLKFYESISNIIIKLSDENNNNLSPTNKKNTKSDELLFISQNISSLILRHSFLETKLHDNIASLKRMQLLTLQSQFNPHFIFNTLNHVSILTLDAGEKGEIANQIICNFSDLMRISLVNKDYIVDINTELSYAEKYIEIEKLKYQNKFDVKWNIDKNLLNYSAVKFMLQPIIENAFIHGIHKSKNTDKRLLSISVHSVNKNIVFQIYNNGQHISNSKMQEIISQLKTNDLPDSKHIGLCNVHQRIKLIFGEEFGITKIESNPEGTTVELTIPMQPYSPQ